MGSHIWGSGLKAYLIMNVGWRECHLFFNLCWACIYSIRDIWQVLISLHIVIFTWLACWDSNLIAIFICLFMFAGLFLSIVSPITPLWLDCDISVRSSYQILSLNNFLNLNYSLFQDIYFILTLEKISWPPSLKPRSVSSCNRNTYYCPRRLAPGWAQQIHVSYLTTFKEHNWYVSTDWM
jgi:hypothetical protein